MLVKGTPVKNTVFHGVQTSMSPVQNSMQSVIKYPVDQLAME